MFPYTEKNTESESDIQNNNLFYKIDPKCQNTFICLETFGNCPKMFENVQKLRFIFCIMYKFHNSYFVIFVNFVIVVIL